MSGEWREIAAICESARPVSGRIAADFGRSRTILHRLRESPSIVVGLLIICGWIMAATFASLLTPYDPTYQDVMAVVDPTPSAAHWLGTDFLGRDILSRILYGGRVSLTLAPAAVAVAFAVGCTLGLVAGYFGGWTDAIIGRTFDLVLSFPVVIVYIILISTIGPSWINIIVAITLVAAPGIGRIVRGMTLSLRNMDYVAAAKIRGESTAYILLVEILPNARGPLIADACLRIGYTVITIGILGFLGLGLPPPNPEWGGMIRESTALLTVWPHMALLPSAAIVSLALGFCLLADGLQTLNSSD